MQICFLSLFALIISIHHQNICIMPKERYVWADALNIIACISVVIVHCTNGAVHNFTEFNFDFV